MRKTYSRENKGSKELVSSVYKSHHMWLSIHLETVMSDIPQRSILGPILFSDIIISFIDSEVECILSKFAGTPI